MTGQPNPNLPDETEADLTATPIRTPGKFTTLFRPGTPKAQKTPVAPRLSKPGGKRPPERTRQARPRAETRNEHGRDAAEQEARRDDRRAPAARCGQPVRELRQQQRPAAHHRVRDTRTGPAGVHPRARNGAHQRHGRDTPGNRRKYICREFQRGGHLGVRTALHGRQHRSRWNHKNRWENGGREARPGDSGRGRNRQCRDHRRVRQHGPRCAWQQDRADRRAHRTGHS